MNHYPIGTEVPNAEKRCETKGCEYVFDRKPNGRRHFCDLCRIRRHKASMTDVRERRRARRIEGDLAVPRSRAGNLRISQNWLCERLRATPCACGEADILVLSLYDPQAKPNATTIAQLIVKGTSFKRVKATAEGFTTRCANCQTRLIVLQTNNFRAKWLAAQRPQGSQAPLGASAQAPGGGVLTQPPEAPKFSGSSVIELKVFSPGSADLPTYEAGVQTSPDQPADDAA